MFRRFDSYKILRVNLSEQSIKEEKVPIEVAKKFIGGKGLAAYYLYRELKPGVDPLSPENRLLFFIGPLTGLFPGFSRHVFAAKSPLTDTFVDSYAGGWFG
ncbi:MAG: aldehyde ferredoxin oxidoreductase, partial [Candidatus Hecatellales archaeon]